MAPSSPTPWALPDAGGSWSLGTSWATPRCSYGLSWSSVHHDFHGFCGLSMFIRLSWCIMVDHWIMVHQFPIVSPLKLPGCSHKGGPPMETHRAQELCGGALAFQVSKAGWMGPGELEILQKGLVGGSKCSTEMELSLGGYHHISPIKYWKPHDPHKNLAGGLKHVNFVIDFRPLFGMSPIVSHILAWPESTNQELFGPSE